MCITASIIATSSGSPAQQTVKACASSSLCPATGSQTFSANLGVAGAVASAKCCNTDNCNAETLPVPGSQTDNSLRCLSCDPFTSQCNTVTTCRGEENQCFQASVTSESRTSPAFGLCIYKPVCSCCQPG
uniref:phospholipase A2 inhibitor and Ly6/PLAUR domain-containing protein-like n=1 Tax=Gasterosteus aculeatus aculeatus TaxID=481459 RepID=UPI001A9800A6|nr:phospholipase A2 inhibitor and Ly6/PLAUR domain-containing protein-like [Gasterosteus aculeatus aculeatus]